MTPVEQARSEGLALHMELRGKALLFGAVPFVGIVNLIKPETYERDIGRGESKESEIHVTRGNVPAGVVVGSEFVEVESGANHRVIELTDHPSNPDVILRCETWKT